LRDKLSIIKANLFRLNSELTIETNGTRPQSCIEKYPRDCNDSERVREDEDEDSLADLHRWAMVDRSAPIGKPGWSCCGGTMPPDLAAY
jgi:hypothetical protein